MDELNEYLNDIMHSASVMQRELETYISSYEDTMVENDSLKDKIATLERQVKELESSLEEAEAKLDMIEYKDEDI